MDEAGITAYKWLVNNSTSRAWSARRAGQVDGAHISPKPINISCEILRGGRGNLTVLLSIKTRISYGRGRPHPFVDCDKAPEDLNAIEGRLRVSSGGAA